MLKIRPSNFTRRALVALLFTIPLSLPAIAQEQSSENSENTSTQSMAASDWLSKMAQGVSELNYTISFVLLKPGVDSQPYLWRHGIDENGLQMEQLNLLNGPGKEVVRIGNKVSYFEPNMPPYSLLSSTINGPFPGELFQQPEKLADSYEFVMVGRSRISGRTAQQIRIVSKDKSRYGLNLWLDQQTGLLLKMNMFNTEGELLEQIQVTGLQVTEKPDPFFAKIDVNMLPAAVTFGSNTPNNSPWEIAYLPAGMSIIKHDLRRLSTNGDVVEYFMLSDGLVNVSVYLQDRLNQQPLGNLLGTVQSDTLLTLRKDGLNITVIGKLPAGTANAIATSVQRVN